MSRAPAAETAGGADETNANVASRARATARSAMSKREFNPELNLARRAGLSRREARSRDFAEGRAAHDVTWGAEVGMVEEIEDIRAELQAGTGHMHVPD